MNAYEESLTQALQKVFENIATTGCPTQEQIKFIEIYKPRPKKRTIDDDIKTAEKVFSLMFGTTIDGGKK